MGHANQTWGMDPVLTGANLRRMRRSRHLSQDGLVDFLWRMGVEISKNSVSSWETGKKRPSIDHLIALRALYGCKLDELIVCRRSSCEAGDGDQLVPVFSPGLRARRLHPAPAALRPPGVPLPGRPGKFFSNSEKFFSPVTQRLVSRPGGIW